MASVALREVSKQYPGGVVAVDHVSLEVHDREFLVLVGPSGCGKSTTLRMIAGLEDVSRGVIEIGGREVTRVAPKDRNIAMVFQNYALYPHMSVRRNMAFGLELRYGGWFRWLCKRLTSPAEAAELVRQRRQIKDRVREASRILGIESLLDRLPRQLSGGERQRVALGRAIVREPAAFLFDEPLSNLDARLRVEMRHELKRLHRRLDATMIYVTHDQVEAMTLGQRIVVMSGGRIQQVGPPMEVYERPRNRFVAGFLGSPPMNFLEGSVEVDGATHVGTTQVGGKQRSEVKFYGSGVEVGLDEWRESCRRDAPAEKRVVLGVRPEDVVPEVMAPDDSLNLARVTLVETLGDQAVVHVETNGRVTSGREMNSGEPATLVCKADARCGLSPGDVVRLRFAASRVHLFDVVSGESLAERV